jgi:hypothetical protein
MMVAGAAGRAFFLAAVLFFKPGRFLAGAAVGAAAGGAAAGLGARCVAAAGLGAAAGFGALVAAPPVACGVTASAATP